jgi:WD40 repeat protein
MGRMLMNPTERGPHFRQKTFHPLFHRLFTGPGHDSVASQLRCPMIDMELFARRHVPVVLHADWKCINIIKVHPRLPLVAYLATRNRQEYQLEIVHLSLDREIVIRKESIDIRGVDFASIMVFHPKRPFLAISCGDSVKLYGLSVDGTCMSHQIATLENHSCQVTEISFSSNDFPVFKIATGDEKGILKILSIRLRIDDVRFNASVELLHSLQSPFEQFTADLGHLNSSRHSVKSMAWSGNMLVVAYENKYLAVIRCHGKKFDVQTYELSINVRWVNCVTIHPSGRFFILSCNQLVIVAYVIETIEDKCVFTVPSRINSMAFALDGKTLAAMGGVEIYIVEVSQDGKRMIILARNIIPWFRNIRSVAVHENVVVSADVSSAVAVVRI